MNIRIDAIEGNGDRFAGGCVDVWTALQSNVIPRSLFPRRSVDE
jgi:hypothetical protein